MGQLPLPTSWSRGPFVPLLTNKHITTIFVN
jgi:hypothetical protein